MRAVSISAMLVGAMLVMSFVTADELLAAPGPEWHPASGFRQSPVPLLIPPTPTLRPQIPLSTPLPSRPTQMVSTPRPSPTQASTAAPAPRAGGFPIEGAVLLLAVSTVVVLGGLSAFARSRRR